MSPENTNQLEKQLSDFLQFYKRNKWTSTTVNVDKYLIDIYIEIKQIESGSK